jgi:hypothetical protein
MLEFDKVAGCSAGDAKRLVAVGACCSSTSSLGYGAGGASLLTGVTTVRGHAGGGSGSSRRPSAAGAASTLTWCPCAWADRIRGSPGHASQASWAAAQA